MYPPIAVVSKVVAGPWGARPPPLASCLFPSLPLVHPHLPPHISLCLLSSVLALPLPASLGPCFSFHPAPLCPCLCSYMCSLIPECLPPHFVPRLSSAVALLQLQSSQKQWWSWPGPDEPSQGQEVAAPGWTELGLEGPEPQQKVRRRGQLGGAGCTIPPILPSHVHGFPLFLSLFCGLPHAPLPINSLLCQISQSGPGQMEAQLQL